MDSRRLLLVLLLTSLLTSFANAQSSDLTIVKDGPAEAPADTNVTYSITLTNLGPDPASAITLTDNTPQDNGFPVPFQMTFVSESHDPSFVCTTPAAGATGTVSCTGAVLAAGASANFTFVFHIPSGTPDGSVFTNIANVSSPTDPNEENNSGVATTSLPPAPSSDLGVLKSGPSAAGPDTEVTYSLTFFNGGPDSEATATLSDTLPGTMTFVSLSQSGTPVSCSTPAAGAGGTITCTGAPFASGASTTLTLTGHIPAGTASGTAFTNAATTSGSNDLNPENDQAVTQLIVSSVDVGVTKSGPLSVTAGDPVSYTIVVENTGPDPAAGVTLFDSLPPGTTFVSLTQNNGPIATCGTPPPGTGGEISCTWNLLAPASAQFTLIVNSGSALSIANTAVVSSQSFDREPSNDTSTANTTVTQVADLNVTKNGPATLTAGTQATYTIGVSNAGPSFATSVQLADTLPVNTTFVSLTQTSGPTFSCTTGPTVTCSIASLAPGTGATFDVVIAIAPSASNGSTISNTATASSTTGDPTANSATTNATVVASADLSVSKTGPGTLTAGANATYTLIVNNAGPSDATSVQLTDTLAGNVTFVSLNQTAGPTFSCTTGPVITCTIAALAPATPASFDLVVLVASSSPNGNTISNTATVSSPVADPAPGNNESTAGPATVGVNADLSITKSGPGALTAGTQATYTIAVNNAGPSDATLVELTDTLPANTSFVSLNQTAGPTFNCTTGGTITCTLASLASGASASFELVVMVSPSAPNGSTISNTASVSSPVADSTPGNNTATAGPATVGGSADLSVTKSGPGALTAGTQATYTIAVSNAGPSDATAAQLTDTLPANTSFVSLNQTAGPTFSCTTGGTITCTLASLAFGASASFELVVMVSPSAPNGSTISNTASVSSPVADPASGNNTSTAGPATVATSADLSVTKSGPGALTAGAQATYTIAVNNAGPSDASAAQLTDTLPANTSFVSLNQTAGPTFNCTTGGTITCTLASLASGASASFELVVMVSPSAPNGSTISNTTTVSSAVADPASGNNTSTAGPATVGGSADLSVTKSGPVTLTAGDQATYTIAVNNAGPSDASAAQLTDTLPANTSFVSLNQTAGPTFNCTTGGTITCTLASLTSGASASFELVVMVSPSAPNGSTISNTATASSPVADPASGNNTSTAGPATVATSADLSVSKSGPAAIAPGDDLAYTVTITNAGPSDASALQLSDAVPVGTTFVSNTQLSGPSFTCSDPAVGATGDINCTIASFASGSVASFSFVFRVNPTATGTITNTAIVSSATTDSNAGNGSFTTSPAVVSPATTDLSITKTASGTQFGPGATVTYTIVATNDGPAVATNVVVTDVLPSGTTLVSATASQGSCSGTTTVTCNAGVLLSGEGVTITLVITLPATYGPVSNTATVTSDNADSNSANNSAAAAVAVTSEIPALSPLALALLAMALAGASFLALKH